MLQVVRPLIIFHRSQNKYYGMDVQLAAPIFAITELTILLLQLEIRVRVQLGSRSYVDFKCQKQTNILI